MWDLSGWPPGGDALVSGHREPALPSASFSADGTRVVTASEDKTARVWDLTGAAPPCGDRARAGIERIVLSASFSADGKRVVTRVLGQDGACVGPVRLGAPVATACWSGHRDALVSSLASFSADGKAGGHRVPGQDGACVGPVRHDPGGDNVVWSGHQGPVASASFSTDGTQVVTAS